MEDVDKDKKPDQEGMGIKSENKVEISTEEVSPTTIGEISIVPIRNEHGLVAIASCVIDEKFFVGSIGIYFNEGTYRLTYPTKKHRGSSMTLFHPINVTAGEAVFNAIVKEYEELLTQGL